MANYANNINQIVIKDELKWQLVLTVRPSDQHWPFAMASHGVTRIKEWASRGKAKHRKRKLLM